MVDRVYPGRQPDEPDDERVDDGGWLDERAPFVADGVRPEEGLQTPSVRDLQQRPPATRECLRIRVLLRDHADGDLPEALRAEVEDHVHGCADCDRALSRAEFEVLRLRRVIEEQLPARAMTPPADFTASVLQRVRESEFDSVQLAIDHSAPANFTPRVMDRVRKEWGKPRGVWGLARGLRRHWLASLVTAAIVSIAVGAGWRLVVETAPTTLEVVNPVLTWVVADSGSERPAADGDELAVGEELRVGAAGKATLVRRPGSGGPPMDSDEFELAAATRVVVRGFDVIDLQQGRLTIRNHTSTQLSLRNGARLEFERGTYSVSLAGVERVDGQLYPHAFMRARIEAETGVASIVRGSLARIEVRDGYVAEFDGWSPVRVERAFDRKMLRPVETTAVAKRLDEQRPTHAPGTLVGRVIDAASGEPVVGATIGIRTAVGPQVLTTGPDGQYALRGGENHGAEACVEVTPGGNGKDGTRWAPYGPVVSRLDARVGNDGVLYLDDIRLERDLRVAGTVVDPLLKPLAGAAISMCVVDELRGAVRRVKNRPAVSAADGHFELSLPATVAAHEILAILVEHPQFPLTASLALASGRDRAGKPLELRVAAARNATLSGLPLDEVVEVLEGVPGLPAGAALRRHAGRTDASGRLQLAGVGAGPFWRRRGDGQPLAMSFDDAPTLTVAAAVPLPRLPATDPEDGTWLPFDRDRYDAFAQTTLAGGGPPLAEGRRHFVTVRDTRLARVGTQLFRWSSDERGLVYLGEYQGEAVPVVSAEGESFDVIGIAPDGAVGVLKFDGASAASQHALQVLPPGGAQLSATLQPRLAEAGRLSILRFEMIAGPLKGMVVYREVTADDDWVVEGLVPGFYHVSFALGDRIVDAICRVVSGVPKGQIVPR